MYDFPKERKKEMARTDENLIEQQFKNQVQSEQQNFSLNSIRAH